MIQITDSNNVATLDFSIIDFIQSNRTDSIRMGKNSIAQVIGFIDFLIFSIVFFKAKLGYIHSRRL